MHVQLLERPLDAAAATLPQEFGDQGFAPQRFGAGALVAPSTGDNISRMLAPGFGGTSTLGPLGGLLGMLSGTALLSPLGGLLQQLGSLLQQIFGSGNGAGNGLSGLTGDNEQYFSNANGGSVGDPHLTFNGSTWNSMQSQSDLLHSDSFAGGYQVSTVTTPPNAQGVTYNQQATVSTNGGQTNVSMDKDGNATIQENGMTYPVQAGAAYDLGNGEIVSRDQNGTLTITCDNGSGGQITTTMRANGTGVDVNASANNVDLGGALVAGAPNGTAPAPAPAPTPAPFPHPQPIRYRV